MEHLNLSWVDWGIISIIALSTIVGVIRGFVREALSLTAWGASIWASVSFSDELLAYIGPHFGSQMTAKVVSFALIFLGVLISVAIINFIVLQLVKMTGLGGTDRLVGIVFGAFRGGLVVSILILFAQMTAFNKVSWWNNSQLIPYFEPMANWVQQFIPESVKSMTTKAQ